jgi:hypothetical protein
MAKPKDGHYKILNKGTNLYIEMKSEGDNAIVTQGHNGTVFKITKYIHPYRTEYYISPVSMGEEDAGILIPGQEIWLSNELSDMPDMWSFIKGEDDGYYFIINSDGWEFNEIEQDGEMVNDDGNWNENMCLQPTELKTDKASNIIMNSLRDRDFMLFKLEEVDASEEGAAVSNKMDAEDPIKLFIIGTEKEVAKYQGKDMKVIFVKIGLRNESDKKISNFHDLTMYIEGYFEGVEGEFLDITPMKVLFSLDYTDKNNELLPGAEDFIRIGIVVEEHYKGFGDLSDAQKDKVFENLEYKLTNVSMAYSYTNEDGETIIVNAKSEAVITLSVTNADLSDAPGVVVEPNSPPYNLGSWKKGATPVFRFQVKKPGEYTIKYLYSKQDDGSGPARMQVFFVSRPARSSGTVAVEFPVTGGDWSNYAELTDNSTTITLGEGPAEIHIEPDQDDENEYMINLRSITLYYAGEIEADSN